MRITPATRARLHKMLDALLDECDSGTAHGETIVIVREVSVTDPATQGRVPLLLLRGIVNRGARILPDLVAQIRAQSRPVEP